jgi:hypothetical protein
LLDLFLYLFRIHWCVGLHPLPLPVHLDVLRPRILPALVAGDTTHTTLLFRVAQALT